MNRLFWILTLAALTAGCANPLNERHVGFYTNAGGQAEASGDWILAEKNFERAMINANIGNLSDREKSLTMYNLGRAKGHLCKFNEAEKLLTDSLALETSVTGPESGITAMRLFELGRLHYDRQQFKNAEPYFSRAVPIAVKLNVEQSDPLGLALVYEDYSVMLGKLGKQADAENAKREANRLRASYPGKSARFIPSRYPQNCNVR